jgi:hypothetical protein
MPVGPQSNIPYAASNWVAMAPGNVYKSAIDVSTSILSPLSRFYVYQNSPVGMSVLIDVGYNFMLGGSGPVLQPTAAPVSVALVAPGTNPYYATVYWDSVANTFGVVYGAQATSPVPTVPDSWHQEILAFVKLSPGQTSITSSNITDARWMSLMPCHVSQNLTVTSNTTVNLLGAKKLSLFLTTNANMTLTLANLRYHTDIDLFLQNTSGANKVVKIAATTPSGVVIKVTASYPIWAQTIGGISGYGAVDLGIAGAGATVFPSTAPPVIGKAIWSSDQQWLSFR